MASGPHTFVTLSVFSPERFQGNPLAIVAVRANGLTQQKKSAIAKEFGYSETVFMHDAPAPGIPRRIDIFTETGEEVPFAGHPVIGVGHYIFQFCERIQPSPQSSDRQLSTSVMTKAGVIQINYDNHRLVAQCTVPHNVHIHSEKVSIDEILNVQPQIQIVPTFEKCKGMTFPVVSIVKGMTFALVDLTEAPDVLGGLAAGRAPTFKRDKDWDVGLNGAFYYRRAQKMEKDGEPTIHAIQARMITQNMEDPGTGSACCALASYLALTEGQPPHATEDKDGKGTDTDAELANKTSKVTLTESKNGSNTQRHVYAIKQGVEMGRLCTILVEVEVKQDDNGNRKISSVTLSGRAYFFSRGELMP